MRIDLDDGSAQLLDLLIGFGRQGALLRSERDPGHVQRDAVVFESGDLVLQLSTPLFELVDFTAQDTLPSGRPLAKRRDSLVTPRRRPARPQFSIDCDTAVS